MAGETEAASLIGRSDEAEEELAAGRVKRREAELVEAKMR